MLTVGLQSPWVQDLPVCFPTRPCVEYPPGTADVINFTSSLTPSSLPIAMGCFAVLAIAIVLVGYGLQPRRRRLGLWVVAVPAMLTVLGLIVSSVTDVRSNAVSAIYGFEGPGGLDFYGSWWLIDLAGEAMTAAGLTALTIAAAIAVLRLKATASSDSRHPGRDSPDRPST